MKRRKTVKRSGRIDPCKESRSALAKYRADKKAGHKDASPFWLGQSQAFGTLCADKSRRKRKR